ncbi:MAG: transporter [Meiothermus sp.]
MEAISSALVPISLLIALGFGLRRHNFVAEGFWPQLDRVNYWILFPSLLFINLATARLSEVPGWPLVLSVWGGLLGCSLLMLLLRPWLAATPQAFTSVFQGGIRFNSYVALGTLPVLFAGGGALAAILVAVTVPLVNVLCVLVLSLFASHQALRWREVLRSVLTNPLIVACALGAVFNLTGSGLGSLEPTLRALGQASLACGLMSVGATLRFEHLREGIGPILASMLFKFGALPTLSAGLGLLLGVPAPVLAAVTFFQSLPTASASFVLARQMGGDEKLMAAILTVQTVAAFATMPLLYGWLR